MPPPNISTTTLNSTKMQGKKEIRIAEQDNLTNRALLSFTTKNKHFFTFMIHKFFALKNLLENKVEV